MLAFLSLSSVLLMTAPLAPQIPGGGSSLAHGGGITAGTPRPGTLVPKPGGGVFLPDPNRGGRGGELGLAEVRWGRLVDVHALDAAGAVEVSPVLRDVLIDPNLLGNGSDYTLLESAATQLTRLVVRRPRASAEFVELLREAERGTVLLDPRDLDALTHALVPRNAALMLRFDDLLRDDPAATLALTDNVKVLAGTGATTPHGARVRFDAHHGGVVNGAFHSTRVLVDLALSAYEAEELAVPLAPTPTGVPEGAVGFPSLALRLPTRTDPPSGQFDVLRNLAGRPLAQNGNGPLDESVPTRDLVRAARAGNDEDPERGFLLDRTAPFLVSEFPLTVTAASDDPAGEAGFAFVVSWTFAGPAFARPLPGDALELDGQVCEVVAAGPAPTPAGQVSGVRVRLTRATPVSASALLGAGLEVVPFRPGALAAAAWYRVQPAPLAPPADGISPAATFGVRFSEPMLAATIDPYDAFALATSEVPAADERIPASALAAGDGLHFALAPLLPLPHVAGQATPVFLSLATGASGAEDLAGNALASAPARARFRLDPAAADEPSGGVVLTFTSFDELPGAGANDLRGAYFLDLQDGTLLGRPPHHFSAGVERTNPVTSIQIPFARGVETPLVPLGAKLQSVWRYADLGWSVFDESKYDVDVVGLNWSPVGAAVVNDFFPEFEVRLAHARNLPDEGIDNFLLPRWPNSGLPGSSVPFDQNPIGPQEVVHPRNAGYQVRSADLFTSLQGTPLMPYPLNRGSAPTRSYTWRDTSLEVAGGANGAGVPLDVEVGPPLDLEPATGTLAPAGAVPSVGLPLLMEFRCFPASAAVGLNRPDINLAINSSARPAFRTYSAGGFDRFGQPIVVLPDTETHPLGGFNPSSTPPGQRTLPNDNVVYIGQVDLAWRVSRAHSVWIDTLGAADFAALQVLAGELPAGTRIELAARGATGFSAGAEPFDAAALDTYGALEQGTVEFLNGSSAWQSDLDALDGARCVQLRVTLVNDLEAGARPTLDALALAYRR